MTYRILRWKRADENQEQQTMPACSRRRYAPALIVSIFYSAATIVVSGSAQAGDTTSAAGAREPVSALLRAKRIPAIDHDDGYAYRLPYGSGVTYPVTQTYGSRLSHRGSEYYTVDFLMPVGTPVHAAREGWVIDVKQSSATGCFASDCARLANYVAVRHEDGTIGEYYHLKHGGVLVEPGEHVERGQLIALSGNTGFTNGPHLHFGVYRPGPVAQSIDIEFQTREGLVGKLRVGARYMNIDE